MSEAILTIRDLKVSYGDFVALNIDKEVVFNAGDCVGILGNNGAGKTTFINACIGGAPYTGTIDSPLSYHNMGVHLQENKYDQSVKIRLLIEAILGISLKNDTRIKELIQFFSFDPCLEKKFSQLSGGEKQKLTLILVMMQDKKIIFFDEITSGLDFLTRKELVGKIKEWYKDKGTSMFFVSHYYDELDDFTNKLMIIDKGNLVDAGYTHDLFAKYCGYCAVTIKNPDTSCQELLNQYRAIPQQEGWHLLFCNTEEEVVKLLQALSRKRLEYRVSYLNLEAIYMKAISQYKEARHEK